MSRGLLLLLSVLLSSAAHALPSLSDLQQQSQSTPSQPLLVIVTQDGCEWCEYVIERHLDPMHRELTRTQASAATPVLRQLDLSDTIIDYLGERVDADDFVSRYADGLTPTILLLGPTGELLTKPLVGVSSRDYYSVYLQRAIRRAQETLNAASDSVTR